MSETVYALSARKLKSGSWEKFRAAWDVTNYEGGEHPPFIDRIVHLRSMSDPDYVISFGVATDAEEQAKEYMSDPKWQELDKQRQAAMAEFVEETFVDGIFQQIEELVPAKA